MKSGAFGSRSFSNDQTLEYVRNNKLRETQASGNFYNTGYLKDAVNHFSDPPYVTIKPGYRAGMPAPTDNQVQDKHVYSFKAYGDQRKPRRT